MMILSEGEMMMEGLKVHFTIARITRVRGNPQNSSTNRQRFKDHYGCPPDAASKIWKDLQVTKTLEAKILSPTSKDLNTFFESLHFLKVYKKESNRESTFDKSRKTLRNRSWAMLRKIRALKTEKIVFPEEITDDIFLMWVDGVNCETNERRHEEFSKDPSRFDHKHNHAGLVYELGTHLFESKLIWMNGPFKAGEGNDLSIFVNHGLKDKLLSVGKKAIADKIYSGHHEAVSTYNAFDAPAVKKFKARAQMRHEQFNGMLKEFACLSQRFRHDDEKFGVCFEAAAVICQYRMENGEPLFDSLAGINHQP